MSSSSRRTPTTATTATATSSRARAQESNENEPPRSPLNPIHHPQADNSPPVKFPGSAALPPKSPRRPVPKVCGSGSNLAKEKASSSSRFLKELHDARTPAAAAAPSEAADDVPCFELEEDPSFWKDRNVQVLIRIRPINGMESALQGYNRCLIQESSQTLKWTGHPETRFTFDHVASETTSQEKLFKVVGLPMVDNCMMGYNSCMFAYGQTGSGKTFTMMGEIHEMDKSLSDNRGMTPRIFEYLFIRIKEEEERRYGEKLKYSCKCSFLEIYNEQITDLLEPSSTNLQLREDNKKGVYVENLKEYDVSSVTDVMDLLLQGAANRKIAATNMNSESSRSHSVFTCIIESQWEKDSMIHLRFGRLNLVDLAGSERQKSSGAEGERLKEAANINRSLSTLGLVIMTLVDITNGKNRHVPYRDSRLTFLLQDSLGGNSKTTIIANISPSICSAGETLSTLKFAQRAKLIQNNAKVNEDASGDVMALQRQIQKLKDQLTVLMKHQSVPRSLCYSSPIHEQAAINEFYVESNSILGSNPAAPDEASFLHSEIKQLETAFVSALRREETAEATVRKLQAEITHMNRLVHQREVEAQRAKTLLKFREEKLRRLELLADDLVSSDGYLMEENVALSQEVQLLRERIDMNPELTQFALENMRLLEQLRMFQNFYQHGERDTLLAEVSHLRNQLLKVHEGRFPLVNKDTIQDDVATTKELDNCRMQLDACLENNAKLTREVDNLRRQLEHYMDIGKNMVHMEDDSSRDSYRVPNSDKESFTALWKEDSGNRTTSLEHADRVPQTVTDQGIDNIRMQFSTVQKELTDAKFLIQHMVARQAQLVAEIDDLKQERGYLKVSRGTSTRTDLMEHLDICDHNVGRRDAEQTECRGTAGLGLYATHERSDVNFKETEILSRIDRGDYTSQVTCNHEMKLAHKKVETETAKPVVYLQTKSNALQQEYGSTSIDHFSSMNNSSFSTKNEEFDSRECALIQENVKLTNLLAAREAEKSAISYEWEKAIADLTTFLIDGCRSLDNASEHIVSVVESFPRRNGCTNEHVGRAMKVYVEKQTLIANLQKGLEEAHQMGLEMKSKLNSLRGATLAITEAQQIENDDNLKELYRLKKLLDEKLCMIQRLESTVKCKDDHIVKVEKVSSSAFEVIKRLYDMDLQDSTDMVEIKLKIEELLIEKPKVSSIEHTTGYSSTQGSYSYEQHAARTGHMIFNDERNQSAHQLSTTKMCKMLQTLEQRMEKIDTDCSQTREVMQLNHNHELLEAEDRTKNATNFLMKFESAQEIIEEAELVIQALLKVNETVKHEKDWWKQKTTELLTENSVITKDVQQLEASNLSKEKQYENLQDQIQLTMTEIWGLTSSLGGSFQQIQKTTMEELNAIRSDIVSTRQELLQVIDTKRSLLEDIISEVVEEGFASVVLYMCHTEALLEQVMHLNTHSNSLSCKHVNTCSSLENIVGVRRLEVVKDQEIIQGHRLNCSNLGGTRNDKKELSSNQICLQEMESKLEKENINPNHHVPLLEEITSDLTIYCSQETCSRCGLKQADRESNEVIPKRELTRKDDLITGLLFDLKLLQESTSNDKCLKDEMEEMTYVLNQLQHELAAKTAEIETIMAEKKVLEVHLAKTEATLSITMSEMKQTQKDLIMVSDENTKLKLVLEDVCMKKTQTEELVEDKIKVIEGLQREILYIDSSVGGQVTSSVGEIMDELRRVSTERDHFQLETAYLNDKLEMISSLADENEAIAVEARQIAEASRVYAKEKEEEVKVLECSVEELEDTINMMEKKVYDLKVEVESHQLTRRGLELEIQALTKRMLTVENAAVNLIAEYSNTDGGNCQIPRRLDDRIIELCEARNRIEDLEMEKSYIAEEVKQYQEHISELLLHSEAQSSLYQEKFKALEAMISEVKPDATNTNTISSVAEKTEKTSIRTRGSGSPFRCISSLVQQMNLEKDQELYIAKQRIEELEALAASRQKEICMLTARLAAADSMTHDVIRDLLGVKLDMVNYANLIDQEDLQKLLEKAQRQSEDTNAKEKEILNLNKQINDLTNERESLVEESDERKKELLDREVMAERLHRRIQLLTAQNEMLKMDKATLIGKIEELEDELKFSVDSLGVNGHQIRENNSSRVGNEELSKRLAQSDKLLSHMRTSMKNRRP